MSNKPHTPMCARFGKKKKTHWREKKNFVIQAWHVGDNSDLMSVLAASVECRQWLTKHFWVQGTVVLKENSDDLHLIAAKPRASARPAPQARSDRLSYLPRVWRPYARAPPLTPEEVRFLTKRRCKYDIQTSVPIQPEPSKPVRDRRDAGRVCIHATSLCGLEEWIISSHFGTIFTILFFWLFYYFIIGRWRSRDGYQDWEITQNGLEVTSSTWAPLHKVLKYMYYSPDHVSDTFSCWKIQKVYVCVSSSLVLSKHTEEFTQF